MINVSKVSYVAERDIDLLLLEEINVSPKFSAWLLERVGHLAPSISSAGAWHSVTHAQFGESDLILKFSSGYAILIENKIDAPAQPDQSARYQKRGEMGLTAGSWSSYICCIIAPARYLQSNAESKSYDARISYEEIRDWLLAQSNERSDFRAGMLNSAIEQNRRGYSPLPHDDVTEFWLSYWRLASESFPSLEMPRPGNKPVNSDWPDFRPRELDSRFNIVHKMAHGYVDLQMRNAAGRVDEIKRLVRDPKLQVVTAGKSAAIRVVVPKVDRFVSFQAQQSKVIAALRAAQELLSLAKSLGNKI
ncbi:PD-(D/E)XK nuclease family protein [Luteimonas sp. A277]